MLLKEFMQDNMPLSKGSVKVPIKSIRDEYRERYDKLSKDKPFKHELYKTSPGGRVIVHVKVPSETLDTFYYDVLLEVEGTPTARGLENCNVKFFSNCPSFVYTYAYIFYHLSADGTVSRDNKSGGAIITLLRRKLPQDRLLMPGTEDKIGDAVLDNEPNTRNPHRLIMLDKSLYYAVFYLMDNVKLSDILNNHNLRTEAQILASVSDFDTLMAKRKQEERREKRTKLQNQRTEQRAAHKEMKSKIAATSVHKNAGIKPISKMSKPKSTSVRRIGKK